MQVMLTNQIYANSVITVCEQESRLKYSNLNIQIWQICYVCYTVT